MYLTDFQKHITFIKISFFYHSRVIIILGDKMINFNKIKYQRPNYEETKDKVENLIEELKQANTADDFLKVFQQLNLIQLEIEQSYDYADIRNMRDESDEFYQDEINYWNEFKPKFDLLFTDVYKICLNTPFKNEIKNKIPDNFFNSIEYETKTNSKDILNLKKRDNELKKEYRKVINKKCTFKGQEYNLSYVTSFFSSPSRQERKQAHDAYNDFFLENQKELDNIFYKMIKVRNEIAHKLGFKNYSDLSLLLLRRFGYTYENIKAFRNNIKRYILPITKKITDIQKGELGLEKLEYYDTVFYKDEPILLYEGEDLLSRSKSIFSNMHTEIGTFYSQMLDNDYIDLVNRDHKINFAITNYLTLDAYPVITGNFKNKYTDLTTLTHEFGHSFQKYMAGIEDKKHIVSPLLKYPTFDIAEMFSYGMQLISLDYVEELFSKQDYYKYKFLMIKDLITSLPYIAAVDEFQEQIYSNNYSIEEIRQVWLQISKSYNLNVSNEGHPNLNSGGYFYRQNHIFLNPFYYIDYAISYFGAFSIWQKESESLDLFKEMAKVASYYPLTDLISKFKITNPFDNKDFNDLANFLENQLDNCIKK